MAQIFKEVDRVTVESDLPIAYEAVASDLFRPGDQRLVPFLGAGSSLHTAEPGDQKKADSVRPDPATVDSFCTQLGFTGMARDLIQMATAIAAHMQQRSAEAGGPGAVDPVHRALASVYPPSASELAEALCHRAQLDSTLPLARKLAGLELGVSDISSLSGMLKAAVRETGVGSTSAPLLSAASYLEYIAARTALWELMRDLFKTKTQPTATHQLVARAAKKYLSGNTADDYLIVTTNYDRLMEIALENANVPYCAITVRRTEGPGEGNVVARLSDNLQEYFGGDTFQRFKKKLEEPKTTEFFFLKSPKPIVCLHKIHGCLFPAQEPVDSIIITDEDYVWYIHRDATTKAGMLPADVRNLLERKGLLFLGYSFSDWNVRSHFKSILEARGSQKTVQDYSVMREVNPYESAFFRNRDVNILVTALDTFAEKVTKAAKQMNILNEAEA